MKWWLLSIILSVCAIAAKAQMTTRVVRDSLFIPWELVYGPDSNIWFTQKNGYICRLNPVTAHIDTLYYEGNTLAQGEGGMLGMVLHPNFQAEPYVYVAYNYYDNSTYKERIVRYTYSSNALQSPLILLDNIAASNIHNGCRLIIIGDKLYISTGDAANAPNAQNVNSVNGKILRIELNGSMPSDNPFTANPVWTWGHRNVQGMVYANNRIYISEHGPSNDDEISIIQKGRNYGWPTVQGLCNTPAEITVCNDSNIVEPIKIWSPTLAVCGLDYYNHPMFPALQNSLLMTTLKDNKLYRLALNSSFDAITTATAISNISFGRLRDICIGPHGNIFISTSNSTGTSRIDKIIEIYDPNFVAGVNAINKTQPVTVYPNPASDIIYVKVAATIATPLHYRLISVEGKIVSRGSVVAGSNSISITGIPVGTYSLEIRDEHDVVTVQKISKL